MSDPGTRRGLVYLAPDEDYPDWHVGFKHGAEGRDAVSRDDVYYMRGWAAGRATSSDAGGL